MTQDQEPELIYSDLQTHYSEGGLSVEIAIYRLPETEWVLEVIAEDGNSTVWEDPFESDEAAFAEAMQAIKEEGIASFSQNAATPSLH